MTIKSKIKNRFRSMKVTLAVAFLVLSLVVLLIAIGLETFFNFQTQQKVIASQQQLIAQDAANKVKTFIQEKLKVLEATAKFGNLVNASKEEQKLILNKLLGIEPIFREAILLDTQKQELVKISRLSSALPIQLTEQIKSDIFLKVSQEKTYISSVYIDKITSEPMIIMAIPITNIFGDFKGILMAEVNLKFMWDLLDVIKIGKNGLAYVVDRQGNLIAYSDISRVLKGENLIQLRQVAEFVNGSEPFIKGDAEISQGIRNNRVVANYMPLGVPDWAVVAELPVLEAYDSIIRMLLLSAGIILISIVLAIVAGIYISKKITKPIIKLRDAAIQIGEGNLDTRITINTDDEIGELAESFNKMTLELKKSKKEIDEYNSTLEQKVEKRTIDLKLSEKRFKDIAFSSADWIWELDENRIFTYCSEKVEDILGYSKEEIIGKPIFDLIPPKEVKKIEFLFSETSKSKKPIKDLEIWILTKTGKQICLLTNCVPFYDNQDKFNGFRGINKDITDQKTVEASIKESELQYRRLFENATDGILILNFDTGQIIDVNPFALEKIGCSKQEIIDKKIWEIIIFKGSIESKILFQEIQEKQYIKYENLCLQVITGEQIDVEFISNVYFVNNQKVIQCNIRDISKRKFAEEALRKSEEKYRTLFETMPNGFYRSTPEGYFVDANPAFVKMLGYDSKEELLKVYIPANIYVKPEEREIFARENTEFVNNLEIFRLKTKDGRIIWLEDNAKYIKDENGKVIFNEGICRDITDRKQAEEKLRESEEKLSTLFGSMTEMVVLHELVFGIQGNPINYRITDCNNSFTQITGIQKTVAIGRLATDVYQTENPPYLDVYALVAITGKPHEYTTYFAPMDKHFRISVVSPKKNHFATITTDITLIKQAQDAISAKKVELENYLYIASHDLRSPMVNIQGFSQRLQKQIDKIKTILEGCVLEEEIRKSLIEITNEGLPKTINFILSNTNKMDSLINGLLQISRTGRIKMVIQKIDMNHLCENILANNNFQISEISAKVIVDDLPDCYGDKSQLNQLFSNIIGNAIKYRDKTKQLVIHISGQIQYNKVIYSIKDTGIGISQKYLEKIWDVFFRIDSNSSESGEGLGLSLAKRITDKHNGKIWVESEEGEGSTFYIELQKNEFTE
ncbi:MAG: PAS domain S-box protein [Bacteroidales bacterium]|nr:PAS domain S-box protein [Bacteroidales bacterium]